MPHLPRILVPLLLATLLVAACGDRSGKVLDDPIFPLPATTVVTTPQAVVTPAPAPLSLVASWVDGTPIPERHTCAGDGVTPALTWLNVPPGTAELAMSVVDLDTQDVLWLVYAISPSTTGLVEGQVPAGALIWPNSAGVEAWEPPCPLDSETHTYQFTVYALNQQLEVADDAGATEVLSIVNATTIASSSVSGLSTGGP